MIKAPLTFAAIGISVPYDSSIPALTYKIEGFENGDTTKVLSGRPLETTTAKQGWPPGVYPITIQQHTLSAENYTFIFKGAELTITKP